MSEYNITCPHCQENLAIPGTQLNKVISCDSCGESLRAPTLPELARQSGGSKLCPFCSESIRSTAKKCKHCGEFLSDRSAISSQQKVRKGSLKVPWWLILFGYVLNVMNRMVQHRRDITENPLVRNRHPTPFDELALPFFVVAAIAATVAIFKGRFVGGFIALILSLLMLAAGLTGAL